MTIAVSALVPGDWFQDTEIIQGNVLAATVFAKGDVVFNDTTDDTWKQAGTGATAKVFGVAVEASASTSAAKKIRIAVAGQVVVIADGAIGAHNRVKVSGATAGQVVEALEAGTPDAFNTIVGQYYGNADANMRNGVTIPAAADNDKIIIKLGLGGGGF